MTIANIGEEDNHSCRPLLDDLRSSLGVFEPKTIPYNFNI